MDYNLQQKAEIVKLYYKHKYSKIVQDVMKKQYPDNKVKHPVCIQTTQKSLIGCSIGGSYYHYYAVI